jgi:hypothetical protein
VFENTVLRDIFVCVCVCVCVCVRERERGNNRRLEQITKEELYDLYCSANVIRANK